MADYKQRTKSGDQNSQDVVGANFFHIDGSVTTPVTVKNGAGRLLRVHLNTNGSTLTLRNGNSEVVAVIASDAPEGSFPYGVYCNNSIVAIAGGAVDATIVFS